MAAAPQASSMQVGPREQTKQIHTLYRVYTASATTLTGAGSRSGNSGGGIYVPPQSRVRKGGGVLLLHLLSICYSVTKSLYAWTTSIKTMGDGMK